MKRDDLQARLGLQQIIEAFKKLSIISTRVNDSDASLTILQITRPSALSDYDLLVGAEVKFETSGRTSMSPPGGTGCSQRSTIQRVSKDAFDREQQADSSHDAHATGSNLDRHPQRSTPAPAVRQEMNTRLLARALNIDLPGVERLRLSSDNGPLKVTEYDWWPPADVTPDILEMSLDAMPTGEPTSLALTILCRQRASRTRLTARIRQQGP